MIRRDPDAGWIRLSRAAVGVFLTGHYLGWLGHAEALFGGRGTLPSPADNPFPIAAIEPVLSLVFAAPTLFVGAMVALSLCLAANRAPRRAAVLLFVGMVLSWHRNQLILNPSMPFLGVFLLAHAFMPPGPDPAFWRRFRDGLWWIVGAAYTFSGITKLMSPSWRSGDAGAFILGSPLGRDHALVGLLEQSPTLVTFGTYAMLGLELAMIALSVSKRTRPYAWLGLIALHLSLLATVNIADITLGMIAFHLVQLEPEWLERFLARVRGRRLDTATVG